MSYDEAAFIKSCGTGRDKDNGDKNTSTLLRLSGNPTNIEAGGGHGC